VTVKRKPPIQLPRASDLPYWKTGASSASQVLEKAAQLVRDAGGKVFHFGQASDEREREAYVIEFRAGGDTFRMFWPVSRHEPGQEKAARRQAAAMLFHDVKAKIVKAKVFGVRVAFLDALALPDGRIAAQACSDPEFAAVLDAGHARRMLGPGS